MAKISSCACWIAGRFRRDHQLVSHPLRIPFEATTCGAAIVDGLRATHRSARFPLVVGTLVALSVFGCNEFPAAPEQVARISVSADSPWPSPFVQDIDTIAIDVRDALGVEIQGLEVDWASSDPTILEVTELHPQPPDSSFETVLTDQLRAVIEAHRRGTVEISIVVRQPGFRRDSIVVDSITVQEHWIQVSAGVSHTCAITIDHDAYCWGSGLIGNGNTAGSAVPAPVIGGLKFKAISAGNEHTCGILLDGRVQCWGRNTFGAVGNNAPIDQLTPVGVALGQTFSSISTTAYHVCGIVDATGEAFCWGDNHSGQLGDARLDPDGGPDPPFDVCLSGSNCSLSPRRVENTEGTPTDVTSISPGVAFTCGISASGGAICWGEGGAEIGSDTLIKTDSLNWLDPKIPIANSALDLREITAGSNHNCAIGADRLVYCWGLNSFGQLGDTATTECNVGVSLPCSTSPLRVNGGMAFREIEAGLLSTCGITMQGEAYCWGSNDDGQLGVANAPDACTYTPECSLSPLKPDIPDDPEVVSISVGDRHACAVTARGALYCWGDTSDRKLGSKASLDKQRVAPTRVDEPER